MNLHRATIGWGALLLAFLVIAVSCTPRDGGRVAHGGEEGDGGEGASSGGDSEASGGGIRRVQPAHDPPVSITVLGLRSATAEEEVAREMTAALRQAAENALATGYRHSGGDEDLYPLMMIYGCEQPTNPCLQQIGEALETEYFVFGLIEPEPGHSNDSYIVALSLYRVIGNEVVRSVHEVVSRGEMTDPARRFYSALTGVAIPGELEITCNVEGAEAQVDGESLGSVGAEPLIIGDLEPGRVGLTVSHDGYTTYERNFDVVSGRSTTVTVELSAQ